MKISKKNLVVLHIRNNKTNWVPVTRQTQNIREKTNLQIKQLGERYFQVKNLFEQLKFNRDKLFYFGKEIEKRTKEIKTIDRLQSQNKRLKEAIYCWFAENFYTEIFEPNSALLKQMIEYNKNSISTITEFSSKTTTPQMQQINFEQIETPNSSILSELQY